MKSPLIADVRAAYAERPNLQQLVDDSVIETLGLTQPEVTLLCALLLTEGRAREAADLAIQHGLKERLLPSVASSLEARELIARDTVDQAVWHFDGAERILRMLNDEEAEAQDTSPKLVLGGLRRHVIMLARSGTLVGGLSKVYSYCYGSKPAANEYGILGVMGKELGRDEAALFLLEFAHREMRFPLKELLPLARARATQFRPVDAPAVEDQKRYLAAIAQQARDKRTKS